MDRRRHYRVEPDEPSIEVILAAPDGAGRVEAESPPLSELTLPIGSELRVLLRDTETGPEANLVSRLVHRRDHDRAHTLGIQFLDLRAAEVTLEAPASTGLPLQQVRRIDVSTGGLAEDVPLGSEAKMAAQAELECLFLLPGDRMPVAVRGRIRHRTLDDAGVRYGIQVTNLERPAFERAHDAILGYVLRRHRELGRDVESGRVHILELLRAGGEGR